MGFGVKGLHNKEFLFECVLLGVCFSSDLKAVSFACVVK